MEKHCKHYTGITENTIKIFSYFPTCVKKNLGLDPHVDRHRFDVSPDPDLDRHQNGNSDTDAVRL